LRGHVNARILVVDDDTALAEMIGIVLRTEGFEPFFCEDGTGALEAFRSSKPDLVLLDLMLPGINGIEVCASIREESGVPIIMLTAKSDEVDRILGLEMGADDYLAKPFNPRELLARIRAVLRRSTINLPEPASGARVLTFLGWRIDRALRELTSPDSTRVVLTDAEFDLLQVLCERPGRILSRDQLLDLTQGRSAGAFERSIDILVSRLRRKIEAVPHDPSIIKTVRSGGYLFTPAVELA